MKEELSDLGTSSKRMSRYSALVEEQELEGLRGLFERNDANRLRHKHEASHLPFEELVLLAVRSQAQRQSVSLVFQKLRRQSPPFKQQDQPPSPPKSCEEPEDDEEEDVESLERNCRGSERLPTSSAV